MGGLKSLFFIQNEDENKKTEPSEIKVIEATKFPSADSNTLNHFATTPVPPATPGLPLETNPACQPHLEKIVSMYESGFDGLNQAGYDFYEYYKAVSSAGADNPAVYPMALTMAKSMDNTVTKEKLVSQSEYYVTEIMKVHTQYVNNGNVKKNELLSQKENEKKSLSDNLESLRLQLEAITNQIAANQMNLVNIDTKYSPDLTEVECKLMANDVAKDKILTSINKVKEGLINNIK